MEFRPTELMRWQTDFPIGEHRVRALTLLHLREILKGYGVEATTILHRAELRPEVLDDEFAWIPLRKLAAVLTLSAEITGDPCFGLKYGSAARFTSNPLSYLMTNAPNVRTALKSCAQFHAVVNSNPATFTESNGVGRIDWSYPLSLTNSLQITGFLLMRFIRRIQSVAGGDWHPLSVGLAYRQPAELADYADLLGPKIAFDQPTNSIVIAGSTLSLPTPRADPQLFKLLSRFCAEQLERQKASEHPLNQVREAMIACLEQGSYGPNDVGKVLGIASGALHRQLKAEGTSFQRLLDDTRRCLTHRYLTETSLKLTDIATKVGYSELSAFSRAARRWFGMSPRSLRRSPSNLEQAA